MGAAASAPKKSKYKNKKVTFNGIQFDSKKESMRYSALLCQQQLGLISDLKLQVPFELLPRAYFDAHLDKSGKEVDHYDAVIYKADFTYMKDGKLVVEDVKGCKTPVYILKKKLMYYRYGIIVQET